MLLGAISSGTMLGFSSPLIPGIQNDTKSHINVGKTEASWIGVSFSLSYTVKDFCIYYMPMPFNQNSILLFRTVFLFRIFVF